MLKGDKKLLFLQIAENHKRSIKMCALMDKRALENENPYTVHTEAKFNFDAPSFFTNFEFPAKNLKILKLNLNLVMYLQT